MVQLEWSLIACSLVLSAMVQLESKRDALVIENEEQVTLYYRIRQQLLKLEAEMQVL